MSINQLNELHSKAINDRDFLSMKLGEFQRTDEYKHLQFMDFLFKNRGIIYNDDWKNYINERYSKSLDECEAFFYKLLDHHTKSMGEYYSMKFALEQYTQYEKALWFIKIICDLEGSSKRNLATHFNILSLSYPDAIRERDHIREILNVARIHFGFTFDLFLNSIIDLDGLIELFSKSPWLLRTISSGLGIVDKRIMDHLSELVREEEMDRMVDILSGK